METLDTNVWIKLNENSEIEMILYSYGDEHKDRIDMILELTQEELIKVKNIQIPYKKTFEELNKKYKSHILETINKDWSNIDDTIWLIMSQIRILIPKKIVSSSMVFEKN